MSFTKKNSVLLLRMSADTPSMENAPHAHMLLYTILKRLQMRSFFLISLHYR